MKTGRLSPTVRSTSVGIRHMNQPLKSTSMRRCSQRALRRLRPAKSQSVSTVGRRHPPEAVVVDDLAEAVQPGLGVEAEHVPADDGRAPAQVAEGDRAHDALRLADHVVVHAHHVRRPAGLERLELRAGVAAGAAHVALLDDPQLVPEGLLRGGEVRVVGDLLGALLDDDDLVEDGAHVVVGADLVQQPRAEVGAVHRGDADGDGARAGPVGGHVGLPGGLLEHGAVRAGDDVEPVPPAVAERRERQVEAEVLGGPRPSAGGVDALRAAVGHRAVDDHRRARPGHGTRAG